MFTRKSVILYHIAGIIKTGVHNYAAASSLIYIYRTRSNGKKRYSHGFLIIFVPITESILLNSI